jgi:hypothetical protein
MLKWGFAERSLHMSQMQKKNLTRPDETRDFPKGKLELVTIGGVTFGRGTFQPGWK